MDERLKKWLLPVLFLSFLSGCASVPLQYEHPTSSKSSTTELRVALTYPVDQRPDKEAIDSVLQKNPVDDLSKIMVEEVESMGLFKEVVPIAKEMPIDKVPEVCRDADLVMDSCLKKLSWEVPDYEQKQAAAFVSGFAFGIVGGMIYGMTKTDVYGNANLRVTLVRQSTGETLIDKDYVVHIADNVAKINCDTPEMRSKMAGKAIKAVMEKLKADLANTVQTM